MKKQNPHGVLPWGFCWCTVRGSNSVSRKVRFSLRSVTANAGLMRLLISPLKSIINAFLNGQLVLPFRKTKTLLHRSSNLLHTAKAHSDYAVGFAGAP